MQCFPSGETCVLDGSTNEESMEEIIDPDDSASSHLPDGWHAIDWRRVDQQVRTMQMRIAKATQEGDWRRVKALQRSLTRSFSARALAVRRVTENQRSEERRVG